MGQGCQQIEYAGQHAKPLPVRQFYLLDKLEFRRAVQIGTELRDSLDGPAPVGGANRSLRVNAAHQRPFGPTALDGSHRGDENAVHIEENSLAGNLDWGRSDGGGHDSIVTGGGLSLWLGWFDRD